MRVSILKSPRLRKAILSVTDNAAKRISQLLSNKDPRPTGIKLGVRTRGCNGLSYTMDYATEPVPAFEKVEDKGVTIFVDPKALLHIIGTEMDWTEDELRAEFVFRNPNAKGSCGCGESFNV